MRRVHVFWQEHSWVMIKRRVLGIFCGFFGLCPLHFVRQCHFSCKEFEPYQQRFTKTLRSFSHCSSVREKMLRRAFRAGIKIKYPSMIFSKKAKPPNSLSLSIADADDFLRLLWYDFLWGCRTGCLLLSFLLHLSKRLKFYFLLICRISSIDDSITSIMAFWLPDFQAFCKARLKFKLASYSDTLLFLNVKFTQEITLSL